MGTLAAAYSPYSLDAAPARSGSRLIGAPRAQLHLALPSPRLRSYCSLAETGNNRSISVLLRGLNSTQACRYLDITEGNKSQRTFLYGWVRNRVQMPK